MQILSVWLSLSSCFIEVISMSCGIDNALTNVTYEGVVRVETYPWLGILYYPRNNKRYTTAVVLVTRQFLLATAVDIDKLPKEHFRERARVIVGVDTSRHQIGIGIRDYTYHPDYDKSTYSAIALIQLETDLETTELRPICPPPKGLYIMDFYAMVLSDDYKQSTVTVHKMILVPPKQCETYYRRTGLDIASMWPSHTACAKSIKGGRCVWRSGAILVVKVGKRWSLLGFGVNGPGCHAPARFLDYGMYQGWVRRSIEGIGRPAITRVAENHVVLRRSLSNIQRFGPCDKEEMKEIFYQEHNIIKYNSTTMTQWTNPAKYQSNLTIIDAVEYSCVVLEANYEAHIKEKPKLRLRRWCGDVGRKTLCSSGLQIEIKYYMQIDFNHSLEYRIKAYGKPVKAIDPSEAHKIANNKSENPVILPYSTYRDEYSKFEKDKNYPLFFKKRMISRNFTITTTTEAPTTPENPYSTRKKYKPGDIFYKITTQDPSSSHKPDDSGNQSDEFTTKVTSTTRKPDKYKPTTKVTSTSRKPDNSGNLFDKPTTKVTSTSRKPDKSKNRPYGTKRTTTRRRRSKIKVGLFYYRCTTIDPSTNSPGYSRRRETRGSTTRRYIDIYYNY